jgi:hypothetical protein
MLRLFIILFLIGSPAMAKDAPLPPSIARPPSGAHADDQRLTTEESRLAEQFLERLGEGDLPGAATIFSVGKEKFGWRRKSNEERIEELKRELWPDQFPPPRPRPTQEPHGQRIPPRLYYGPGS